MWNRVMLLMNSLKSLSKRLDRLNVSSHSFILEMLDCGAACLPYVGLSQSVESIIGKACIKNFLWSHFIAKFNCNNVRTFHFVCPCNKRSSLLYVTPTVMIYTRYYSVSYYGILRYLYRMIFGTVLHFFLFYITAFYIHCP